MICIFLSKAFYRLAVPSLIIFLALGMIMSSGIIGGIYFDNFEVAENISFFALVLIMFYGGFGTKWDTAKPMAIKAGLMSSFGTVVTALVIGFFCSVILKIPFLYGLLFGSVVGSTDAASVFSILRSRKLNLKNGIAPLLEVESGSNDPFAYMMTILCISAIQTQGGETPIIRLIGDIAMQIGLAVLIGAVVSFLTVLMLKRLHFEETGFYPLLLLAIVIFSFSACGLAGGNGFLCVYILGIAVGNSQFITKINTVHFFDSLSWLMQIMLFFILGLLSFPDKLLTVAIPGILISILLIFVARPIATFSILGWFKIPVKQLTLISWVGLRGAASIVFAIISVIALGDSLAYDLFHLVFFVALFSVLIQGTLTPYVAKKLDMVDKDDENSVMKTFTDYFEESHTELFEHRISSADKLSGKLIIESEIPESILIVMIKRDNEIILPKGLTMLLEDDVLVVVGEGFEFFDQ
ncbi:MAG: potassium/proton antiporter [Oscillospiraceae bacterium]|nr:potassium/proton antiporter [Oscillospiraceae bacterium]